MRKRFQKGSLEKVRGVWIARWRQDGERKAEKLGRVSQMTKAQAQIALATLVAPINNRRSHPSGQTSFGGFIRDVFLPFYRRKWKRSTLMTNEDRFANHLTAEFDARALGSVGRDELQAWLDRKGGVIRLEEIRLLFSVLDVRERLIARLALPAGMRPGESFGLKWQRMDADIRQRVYRGDVDSPKSAKSVRHAALSDGLLVSIDEWRTLSIDTGADAWVFPSERLTTPLEVDNCWRRASRPSSGRSVWDGSISKSCDEPTARC
jgi:integrase